MTGSPGTKSKGRDLAMAVMVVAAYSLHAGTMGADLIAPTTTAFDFYSDGNVTDLTPETVDKIRIEVKKILANMPRSVVIRECISYGDGNRACPIDRMPCSPKLSSVVCDSGLVYNVTNDRCEGDRACAPEQGSYNPKTGKCEKSSFSPANIRNEWIRYYGDNGASSGWVDTTNARFYAAGGSSIFGDDYYKLTLSGVTGKNGKKAAGTVRRGENYWKGYIAVISSDNSIRRDLLNFAKDGYYFCNVGSGSYEWGEAYMTGIHDGYWCEWDMGSYQRGTLGPGKHMFGSRSYIVVKPGYLVAYFADRKGNLDFLWTKDETVTEYSEPACSAGAPDYDGICAAAPACVEGIYDSAADACVGEEVCPIDPSLSCVGMEGNTWCSPHPCNSDGMCGIAECVQGAASSSTPAMDRDRHFAGLRTVPGAASVCSSMVCDIVLAKKILYCLDEVCPQGFGVFEENGLCYKEGCPGGSYEVNGVCYKEEQ